MEMDDRIGVAVTRRLMNDVNRFPVEIEGKNSEKAIRGRSTPKISKTLWQWLWCAHNVAADTSKLILLHGDERSTFSPSRIAFRMRRVFGRNHDVANAGISYGSQGCC